MLLDEPESITQNLWLSPGIAPRLTDLGSWAPLPALGFYTFPWVLICAYPIAAPGNGASITQRTAQIQGLAVMWGIIWG
jgi:hypothetical protein